MNIYARQLAGKLFTLKHVNPKLNKLVMHFNYRIANIPTTLPLKWQVTAYG